MAVVGCANTLGIVGKRLELRHLRLVNQKPATHRLMAFEAVDHLGGVLKHAVARCHNLHSGAFAGIESLAEHIGIVHAAEREVKAGLTHFFVALRCGIGARHRIPCHDRKLVACGVDIGVWLGQVGSMCASHAPKPLAEGQKRPVEWDQIMREDAGDACSFVYGA